MPIDLFILYILFSHFRPCDATRGNSFFQMSSYAHANVHITNEKNKRQNSHEGITWSEMGKQNVQAKKVYSIRITNHLVTCFLNIIQGKEVNLSLSQRWVNLLLLKVATCIKDNNYCHIELITYNIGFILVASKTLLHTLLVLKD